jgi:hypothetical protein
MTEVLTVYDLFWFTVFLSLSQGMTWNALVHLHQFHGLLFEWDNERLADWYWTTHRYCPCIKSIQLPFRSIHASQTILQDQLSISARGSSWMIWYILASPPWEAHIPAKFTPWPHRTLLSVVQLKLLVLQRAGLRPRKTWTNKDIMYAVGTLSYTNILTVRLIITGPHRAHKAPSMQVLCSHRRILGCVYRAYDRRPSFQGRFLFFAFGSEDDDLRNLRLRLRCCGSTMSKAMSKILNL